MEYISLENLAQDYLHHIGDHSQEQGNDDQASEGRDALARAFPAD